MGQFFTDNWTGLVDVFQTIIMLVSLLVAGGVFVRHRREVKDLLYVAQERDDFRKKHAQLEVRLNNIDPERFIDQANELRTKGDFSGLEKSAVAFAEKQTEAFGLAAEILTEQRILDSEEHGIGAIEEALRFAEIGLAARPESKRLGKLKSLATARAAGIERGEPIEALNMDGMNDVALNRLAISLQKAGKYELAEIAARRSVPLAFLRTGAESTNYAAAIGMHASCLNSLAAYGDAEPLYRKALTITEAALGKAHPDYAQILNNLAGLLQVTGRYDEAEPLYRKALTIRQAALGKAHPDYASSLNNLALLLQVTGRAGDAEPLYREALTIRQAALGKAHPDYAGTLNNLAGLLKATGRFDEAEPLYREALTITEAAPGKAHPDYASSLNNLAVLLAETNRLDEALPLMEQALAIRETALGPEHPQTIETLQSLTNLRAAAP